MLQRISTQSKLFTTVTPSLIHCCCCRATLLERIEEKMEGGVDARDYSWLVSALDQLQVARGVLAPTYPFAYFFFGEGRGMCPSKV